MDWKEKERMYIDKLNEQMREIERLLAFITRAFAEQLVKDHGADGARERSCGPMREAVEQVIAHCEDEAREHEYERGLLHG